MGNLYDSLTFYQRACVERVGRFLPLDEIGVLSVQSSEIFIQRQMEENWRLANQAEQMRLVVATGNLLLATVLQIGIAFLGLSQRALLLTVWMIFLGVYGIFAGKKLYEREAYHRLRVRKLRAKLNDLYPDAGIEKIFKDVEQEHKHIYPRLMYIRLNAIWITFQTLIVFLGVVYSVLCLF